MDVTARTRGTDPDTSHIAARNVRLGPLMAEILDALQMMGPMDSHDIADSILRRQVCVSPALKPMEERGLIRRKCKERSDRGTLVTIWEAVE